MRYSRLIPLAFFFGLVLIEPTFGLGQECRTDADCGDKNQQCLTSPAPCNATYKTCQCIACFDANSTGTGCQPVVLRRPCDGANGDDCDSSCSKNNKFEVYPPNAACDAGDSGDTEGFVQCQPPSCFKTVNRQCVPLAKKPRYAKCAADCECQSNMGCVASCQCPPGSWWDADNIKCSTRKPDLGEGCKTNADCNTNGAHEAGNGFTSSGGVCRRGKCACADGYIQTETGIVTADNNFVTQSICVIDGTVVNVTKGNSCHLDPVYNSDLVTSAVCGPGLACFACEGEKQSKFLGTCRTFTPTIENPDNCNNFDKTPSGSASAGKKVGTRCTADDQCGFNEVCSSPIVDPPCPTGRCACKTCFGSNINGVCGPKHHLYLRDDCDHLGDEIYPKNMICSPPDIVDCVNDRFKFTPKNECVIADYDFVAFGVNCNDKYSTCMPGLLCLPESKKCDCAHSNEIWDIATNRCIKREIGAACRFDHDCDDNSVSQTVPSGRVCLNRTCQCDHNFRPRSKHILNAHEVVPPRCGDTVTDSRTQFCNMCPEDTLNQKCRLFNSSDMPDWSSRNKPEVCFAASFPTTLPPAQVTNVVSQSTSAPTSPPTTNQALPSTTQPPVIVRAPQALAPVESSSNSEIIGKVGSNCRTFSDCGTNELCFSPYDPICSGTCICKPGYDRNDDNICSPTTKRRLGDPCTSYTRPDLYAFPKTMYCENRAASCGECPSLSCPEPGGFGPRQEGDICNDPCDCDGDMACNPVMGVCQCQSLLQRFDTNLKQCVHKTDTTRLYNGIGCNPVFGCNRGDMACEVGKGIKQCKCSDPGYLYNYKEGRCNPRDYNDSCLTDTECQGIGFLVGSHGYSTRNGAICKNTTMTCDCARGYAPVYVATDVVKSLWQQAPVNRTLCLPAQATSGDLVPKGGRCDVNPLQNGALAAICSPGLYCIQCPDETSGKCRTIRDMIRV